MIRLVMVYAVIDGCVPSLFYIQILVFKNILNMPSKKLMFVNTLIFYIDEMLPNA